MKKALVLFSAVLIVGVVCFAQDASTPSANASATVSGCLSASDGSYALTDQNGKSYHLTGKTGELAQHVGHQVEVTGQPSTPPSTTDTASNNSGVTNYTSFEVASTKMVSDRCPTGPTGAKAIGEKSVAVGSWDKGTTATPVNDAAAAAAADTSNAPGATEDQPSATTEPATSSTAINQAEGASTTSSASAAASTSPTAPADQPRAATAPVPDTTASAAQAADSANPSTEAATTTADNAGATTASRNDTALPQTASPLPLFGILALGFLCAGYMTLRTGKQG